MFGIDDDPVQAEPDGHFRDAGRLQRDPHPVDGFVSGEFLPELIDGGHFHDAGVAPTVVGRVFLARQLPRASGTRWQSSKPICTSIQNVLPPARPPPKPTATGP